jgi:15-cis-phytoene synthase
MDAPKDARLLIYPAHHYLASLPPAALEYPLSSASLPYSLPGAYRICRGITRQHSKSFFLATRLLPPAKREAMEALYAFCRTSDDLVDTTDDAATALAGWIAQQRRPAPPLDQPVLIAWADTCARYRLPHELATELLAGVAMDLTVPRYESFAELWVYCYRVASVVGLLSMRIIGYEPNAESYAIRLGIALQLTNILRDIGEDARRGRIYLPLEDLRRFGLTEQDILDGVRDDRFRALMRYQIDRAEQLYRSSWPGIALLNRDGQMAVAAAALLYRGILGKIIASDFDVWSRRAHLSAAEKLLMLPRVALLVRRLRAGDSRLA